MRNYGPKGRGFESSNARHIKNGTGHKVLSHFLFESSRTRTGSIYISFRSLLNACHRHAATSNARYSERLETLKNQWFPAFFRFQVCVKTCDLSISGMFKINFYTYDGNLEKQSAVFEINV